MQKGNSLKTKYIRKKTTAFIFVTVLSACIITGCTADRPGMQAIDQNIENKTENIIEIPDYSSFMSLWDYSDYTFPVPEEYRYNEQEIEEEMQMEIKTTFSALTERREITDKPAQELDTVNISYESFADGDLFNKGGHVESTELVIGYAGYPEGFENALIGMKPGETKTITLRVPATDENKKSSTETQTDGSAEKPGKKTADNGQASLPESGAQEYMDASYTITLNGIYRYELPELTDDIVKEYTGFDTYAAYLQDLHDKIEAEFLSYSYNNVVTAVAQHIVDCSSYTGYPDKTVDELVDQAADIASETANTYNMEINTFLSSYYNVESMDQYKDMIRPRAEDYMKLHMAVCEIARREGISITKNEMDAYKAALRTQYGLDDGADLSEYISDDDMLYDLITEKVGQVLAKHAVRSDAVPKTEPQDKDEQKRQ